MEIALVVLMGGGAIAALVALMRRGVLRRDAFREPKRDVAGLSLGVWGIAAFGLYFVIPIGASIAMSLTPQPLGGEPTLRQMATAQAGALIAGALIVIPILLARRKETSRAGFSIKPIDALLGVGGLAISYPIIWCANVASVRIFRLFGTDTPEMLAHSTLRLIAAGPAEGGMWWWATIGAVVIGAPLLEEVLYRGFVQTAFVRAVGPGWLPIVITSALFTAIHLGSADLHALAGLFVLSLALGALVEITGRIGPAIIAHAAFNALNVALALGVT